MNTPERHFRDKDCTLDPDGTCTVCGVYHRAPCPYCGARGFHRPDCPKIALEEMGRRNLGAVYVEGIGWVWPEDLRTRRNLVPAALCALGVGTV